MNGNVMTVGTLKKKWDMLCSKYEDMFSPAKTVEGFGLLMKMYQWAQTEQICVSAMSVPLMYSINDGDSKIIIRGETSGALCPKPNNKNKFELLKLDFSSKLPDQAILNTKIKFTLDWFSLQKQMPDGTELSGIRIRSVKYAKDFYTTRGEEDFKRMKESFKSIAKCIDNKLYYPRETVMCSSCDIKLYCAAWRGPADGK